MTDDFSDDPEVAHWAQYIGAPVKKTLEGTFETGVRLAECKASVPGKYHSVLLHSGWSIRMAQMYTRIASNPVLTKHENVFALPPHYSKLYLLAQLEDSELQQAIDLGRVWPAMTVNDVKALVQDVKASRGDQSERPRRLITDDPWVIARNQLVESFTGMTNAERLALVVEALVVLKKVGGKATSPPAGDEDPF